MIAESFVFIFGIIFGSFLNVCIHRFPREESIVHPGSHCPHCNRPLCWHENIPLLSFVILRGRCRGCRGNISPRYFFVELASGLIWIAFWKGFGFSSTAAAGILLFSVLLAVTMTDFETGYIPDKLTLPTMGVGLLVSALFPAMHHQALWYRGLGDSALGLLAGGGTLLLTGLLGNVLFKKESMGGGDIKLLAMLGAFLGAKNVLLVFLLAPIVSIPFALYAKFVARRDTIPFGPFLAVTGAWLFLQGDQVSQFLFHI